MGLFGKIFSRKSTKEKLCAESIIEKAFENAKKPQPPDKMAALGGELRQNFMMLVEDVEGELGDIVIAFAGPEEKLMVHPKLNEAIERHHDAGILEIALAGCYASADTRSALLNEWPSIVELFRGKENSQEILRLKSTYLGQFAINILDLNELVDAGLTEEQSSAARLENSILWHRILDELAFRFIQEDRELFVDYYLGELAFRLALLGLPPDQICATLSARSQEYGGYREWIAKGDVSKKGTLLWEAAKHIGEAVNINKNVFFNMNYINQTLRNLNDAKVYELLTGRNPSRES
jgi:hypothetical protein